MSKYRKKPVVIEAEVYKKGMEDGYADKKLVLIVLMINLYMTKDHT